jgi:hypothetical protein
VIVFRLLTTQGTTILTLYKVIKKSLCTCLSCLITWLNLTTKAADHQGQGDIRLTLTPSVIPNSNYVNMVSDWNCLKYFCVFLHCNHRVRRDFLITVYNIGCRAIYISGAAHCTTNAKKCLIRKFTCVIKTFWCKSLAQHTMPELLTGRRFSFSDGKDGDSTWRSQVFWRPWREIKMAVPKRNYEC